jgi:hypothetical protein
MRTELMVLLPMIAGELASLENSVELRNAHANLLNIRRRLARPALTGTEIAVPRSVDGRHQLSGLQSRLLQAGELPRPSTGIGYRQNEDVMAFTARTFRTVFGVPDRPLQQ